MNKYHVTYYYLATGMEGIADIHDYGYVDANTEQEAIEIVGKRRYPNFPKDHQVWGLSAKKVYEYVFVPPGTGMSEQINELEQFPKEKIMNNTLRTQADAITAIRNNQFVIGSVSANGDFSLSASPAVHVYCTDARTEAKRLAQLSPGKAFVILTLTGAEMVPTNTISI